MLSPLGICLHHLVDPSCWIGAPSVRAAVPYIGGPQMISPPTSCLHHDSLGGPKLLDRSTVIRAAVPPLLLDFMKLLAQFTLVKLALSLAQPPPPPPNKPPQKKPQQQKPTTTKQQQQPHPVKPALLLAQPPPPKKKKEEKKEMKPALLLAQHPPPPTPSPPHTHRGAACPATAVLMNSDCWISGRNRTGQFPYPFPRTALSGYSSC